MYSHYGVKDFIICCGYKGYVIKEYFANYFLHMSDVTIDMEDNNVIVHRKNAEPWKITLVDTGLETMTGGRLKRVEKYIDAPFCLTYGDGVSDIDLSQLMEFHNSHDCIGTVTAVRPPSRFGELNIDRDGSVLGLEEKPQMGKGLINGGFFVFDRKVFSYLTQDENCDFEFGPLQEIAKDRQLKAYKHDGFWQCMDNVRERDFLDKHAKDNTAPWIVWE